jgi:hypothetical protein
VKIIHCHVIDKCLLVPSFEPQEMGGHGNEAGSSMTFFLMLNLGNEEGKFTTDYVPVF